MNTASRPENEIQPAKLVYSFAHQGRGNVRANIRYAINMLFHIGKR
jgi:hypothetical protein